MKYYPGDIINKTLPTFRRPILIGLCMFVLLACNLLGATPTMTIPTLPQMVTSTPTATPAVPTRSQTTLHFGGLDWQIRSGTGGPGPNIWDPANAWVDAQGSLHLKLSHIGSEWHSVELNATRRLGFGTYSFDVTGAIDQLDPNVVLGLYTYPPSDVGPDKTNEIDVEMARWGAAPNPNGNYTVWPVQAGLKQTYKTYEFKLSGVQSTHQFIWTSRGVAFQSAPGSASDRMTPYASWNDQPAAPTQYIPQLPVPLNINLWLFQGKPPANGQEVEIVITRFTYTPLTEAYLPLLLK
jgi:hypothetical protein